jgi:hypothetical protein
MLPVRRMPLTRSACLLLAAGFGLASAAAAGQYPIENLRTSIVLNDGIARDLGLEARNVRTQASPMDHHFLSVSVGRRDMVFESLGPLGLNAAIEGHVFERLLGGSVGHRGGFELAYPGGAVDLQGFVLAAGSEPRSFEIRTAEGELVLTAGLAHFKVDRQSGRLQVFNMDLRIAEPFAKRLGQPGMVGESVGILALEARVVLPTAAEDVAGGASCGDWSGQQDVALIAMSTVGQTERSGGRVSITPSATLKNVGTANVPWHAQFTDPTPPYNNDQHPFLVWQFYRIKNGVMEMMAFSDVKHAFLTININCNAGACTEDHTLGLGCEDIYDKGTNESFFRLSYRSEITAAKGLWNSTGSHFDQNGDGEQDHPPANPDPAMSHRLIVPEAELDVAGERYFMEAWYLVRDDINIFNNMGWREVDPNFTTIWQFNAVAAFTQNSALDAWVEEGNPGPNAANEVIQVADGHVRLAMKATDLGGGLWRYEYALMNHDFDPQIGSFGVPTGGASVSDLRFRDLDINAANDWSGAITADGVTWTKPAASEGLDWGRMYNFGFTSDSAPTARQAAMNAVETSTTPQLAIATLGPNGAGQLLFVDGFETADTSQWDSAAP